MRIAGNQHFTDRGTQRRNRRGGFFACPKAMRLIRARRKSQGVLLSAAEGSPISIRIRLPATRLVLCGDFDFLVLFGPGAIAAAGRPADEQHPQRDGQESRSRRPQRMNRPRPPPASAAWAKTVPWATNQPATVNNASFPPRQIACRCFIAKLLIRKHCSSIVAGGTLPFCQSIAPLRQAALPSDARRLRPGGGQIGFLASMCYLKSVDAYPSLWGSWFNATSTTNIVRPASARDAAQAGHVPGSTCRRLWFAPHVRGKR